MSRRPVLRGVVAAAVLLLAAVAVERLPVSYTPRTAFPLISVSLTLGASTDVGEVTRSWLQPIESEIRSLGEIRGMRGEVSAGGAWMQVLFEPRVDPERKAARLISNLSWLRGRLPADSRIAIRPAAGSTDDQVSLLWVTASSPAARRGLAERLRDLPGVREVKVYGDSAEEVWVRLGDEVAGGAARAEEIREAIGRALVVNRVGTLSGHGRQLAVLTATGKPGQIESIPVRAGPTALPLGALARVTTRLVEPPWVARHDGHSGVALAVYKESSASLLAVDHAIRRGVADLSRDDDLPGRVEVIHSQADDLRALLRHLGVGLLLASAGLACLGVLAGGLTIGIRLGLAPALALAAALNAYWLAGVSLNLLTLLGLFVALAAVVPLAALRVLSPVHHAPSAVAACMLCAAALPVAVHLGGGGLSPVLADPARAVFIAVVAAAPTIFVFLPRASGTSRMRWVGRRQRALLRQPLTVLLIAFTVLFVLFTAFGTELELSGTPLQQDPNRLALDVRLPDGATLEQTDRLVRDVEKRLGWLDEIESTWSVFHAGRASIVLDLDRASRRPERRRRLETRLRYLLPAGVVGIEPAYRVAAGGAGGGFALAEELEDRAETDELALLYRVILRSADAELLRQSFERLRGRTVALQISGKAIRPGWGAPTEERALVRRTGTSGDQLAALADHLRWRSEPPPELRLPGPEERVLRVVGADSPESSNDVPRRDDLLGAPVGTGHGPLLPAALVDVEEQVVFPAVRRESGRFVLSVEIAIPGFHPDLRRERREKLDRHLSQLSLPAGVDLERPELDDEAWSSRTLYVIALSAMLPLLLLAIAAFHLNSLAAGTGALLPGLLGLAAVTPQLLAGGAVLDELTLFMLAAATCGSLPVALSVLTSAARRLSAAAPSRTVYRVLRDSWPSLVGGAIASALLLGGSGWLADATRESWARPLRVAATAGFAAHVSSILVLPALALAVLTWVRRDPQQLRRARRPPQWLAPVRPPQLVVRSLTKVYPSGLRALDGVSFEIGPGIVGLLGPNGAGKTTLIRLLTGLLAPTRGSMLYRGVRVDPDNLATFRREIGFLPQDFNTYATVTARQFLEYWALERGMESPGQREAEIGRVLQVVGLAREEDRRIRNYSGGMRRRVGIALALLGDPRVLIVDEPTTGLDIESRIRFRETLLRVAGEKIIIFSTHIPSDIEAVASRLLLLHRGRLRFDGSPADLVRRAEGRVFEVLLGDTEIREFARRYRIAARVRTVDGIRVRAVATPGQDRLGTTVKPSLEEAYLAEIDLADQEVGTPRRSTLFSFLER